VFSPELSRQLTEHVRNVDGSRAWRDQLGNLGHIAGERRTDPPSGGVAVAATHRAPTYLTVVEASAIVVFSGGRRCGCARHLGVFGDCVLRLESVGNIISDRTIKAGPRICREVSMRNRTGLAAALGIIVVSALAGCSAASSGTSSSSTPTVSHHSSPLAVLLAANQTTSAQKTARISLNEQVSVEGHQVAVRASGAEDFAHHAYDLVTTVESQRIDIRQVNQTMYERLPAALAQHLPGGKPWLAINLDALTKSAYGSSLSQLQSSAQSDPSNLLSYLKGLSANGAHLGGTATIRGVQTTEYDVSVDLNKVAAREPAAARAAVKAVIKQFGSSTFPMKVWVDSAHDVRQMSFQLAIPSSTGSGSSSVNATMQLYDFGAAVHVSAPPESQQLNFTGQLLKHLGQATPGASV
jgi:hypothetical protein